MSGITLDLPVGLRAEVSEEISRRGVSEAEWLEEAVREKLAAAKQMTYLTDRASRGNRDEYLHILTQVPAAPPMPGDEK